MVKHLYVDKSYCNLNYPYSFESRHVNKSFQMPNAQWVYPPLSVLKESHYTLLEGNGRFRFLTERGVEKLLVVYSNDLSEEEQLIQAAFNRHMFCPLSIIEKSRLLIHLKERFSTHTSQLLKILSQLGEQSSIYILESLYQLKNIEFEFQEYLSQYNIRLKVLLLISQYNDKDQKDLFYYLKRLALNINQIQIFIESLDALCQKNNISLSHALSSLRSLQVLRNAPELLVQKKRLFNELQALKNPHTNKHLTLIADHIRNFKLQPNWKINIPKNLEGEGIELHFRISTYANYQHALQTLHELNSHKAIGKLFTLL